MRILYTTLLLSGCALLISGCTTTPQTPSCKNEIGAEITLCSLQKEIDLLHTENLDQSTKIKELHSLLNRQSSVIENLTEITKMQRSMLADIKKSEVEKAKQQVVSQPTASDQKETKEVSPTHFKASTFKFIESYEAKIDEKSKIFEVGEPITATTKIGDNIVVSGYFLENRWTKSPPYLIPEKILKRVGK